MRNYLQSQCLCKTRLCPNWTCVCQSPTHNMNSDSDEETEKVPEMSAGVRCASVIDSCSSCKVADLPKHAPDFLKTLLCQKKPFPFGKESDKTFYDPSCVLDIQTCKEICGRTCQNGCCHTGAYFQVKVRAETNRRICINKTSQSTTH